VQTPPPATLRAAPTVVATDDGHARVLHEEESFTIAGSPARRVRYLALRGAIDVPMVLGGRGTLVIAGIGGHEGRPLRRGDLLRAGGAPPSDAPIPGWPDGDAPIRVLLGPDLDRFDERALEALLARRFTIDARSDRTGIRLAGAQLACRSDPAALSAPMVRGAIQVPPSGEPIVLGPDHPTTGGYPVIATVIQEHLGVLAARPIGAPVCFAT
jgi:allophanate hydrolase subunit 2